MTEIDENTDDYAFALFVSRLEISAKQRSKHSHKNLRKIPSKQNARINVVCEKRNFSFFTHLSETQYFSKEFFLVSNYGR